MTTAFRVTIQKSHLSPLDGQRSWDFYSNLVINAIDTQQAQEITHDLAQHFAEPEYKVRLFRDTIECVELSYTPRTVGDLVADIERLDEPRKPMKTCHATIKGKLAPCGKQMPHEHNGPCPSCGGANYYFWV